MCCDAKTFVDLCKLYPRSAELVIRDAEIRNQRLLQYIHSKRHLKPEVDVHKRFDNILNGSLSTTITLSRRKKTKKAQNVLVRTLLKLKAQKREEDYKKLVGVMISSLQQTFRL